MKTRKFKVEVGSWPFNHFVEDITGKTIAKLNMRSYSSKDVTLQDTLKHSEENIQVIKDATLLASAPELLENLIRLVDRLEENGMGDMSAVRRAKEIINKAS